MEAWREVVSAVCCILETDQYWQADAKHEPKHANKLAGTYTHVTRDAAAGPHARMPHACTPRNRQLMQRKKNEGKLPKLLGCPLRSSRLQTSLSSRCSSAAVWHLALILGLDCVLVGVALFSLFSVVVSKHLY